MPLSASLTESSLKNKDPNVCTDVVIVGCDFFSCCSALILAKLGFSVALCTQNRTVAHDALDSLCVLWPTLNDPPTRALAAHGKDLALYLDNFCRQGIDLLFAEDSPWPALKSLWQHSTCIRMARQDFQQQELAQAQALGFPLSQTSHPDIYKEHSPAYICNNPALLSLTLQNELQNAGVCCEDIFIHDLKETQNQCVLTGYAAGTTQHITAEVVILGEGFHISSLCHRYSPILVPMTDTITEYTCATLVTVPEPLAFRGENGHIAGCLYQSHDRLVLKITGPRFLLKNAGVGLTEINRAVDSETQERILKFHQTIFSLISKHFSYQNVQDFLTDFAWTHRKTDLYTDCHPCDELPLVGEYGTQGRVLGFAGFLATGLAAGLLGAKIVSDLICMQKSSYLQERLQPRRFYNVFRV